MRSLVEFMESSYHKPLKIEDFAYLTGRSVSTFHRDFKARFNSSPKQWLIDRRMEKASRLLAAGSMKVAEVATVSDAQLVRTMRFFAERMKLVVEPTGCLAAAAVLERVLPLAGKRVGVIVSGGNIDAERYARLLLEHADTP